MVERDRSADGFRNRVEDAVLNGLRPLWAFVNRTPALAHLLSGLLIGSAVKKLPARPMCLSTMHDYTSWAALNDRTWFSRYLPPAPQVDLPPMEEVAKLYQVRPEGPRLSTRSTLLFPAFAQWFTDGFLMTDNDRRRTRTNHEIDLCQLYGLNPTMTAALRLNDDTPGRRGRLLSVITETGEWAPPLFDDKGERVPGFEALPDPTKLPSNLALAKKRTLFAFGGERANSNLFTAAMNTLFLREHNRLSGILERNNPSWDDERVFETARNINIVQLIRIVVQEYINHISPYWLQLLADPAPAYRAIWNRPNWIPVEFNLLYRWHSLIPSEVCWEGQAIPITDCQFDNGRPLAEGLESAFTSASATRAWAIGLFNTVPMLGPVELASVRQGRDNRLASYNDYRVNASYPRVTRFEQISSDPVVVEGLRRVYGHVDRVEFFVGLFAEDLPPRSAVPALIGRMVAADAFSHALTNPLLAPAVYHAATFTQEGLDIIEGTGSLADLVARNTKGWGDGRVSMQWGSHVSSA
jgi:prostaglandin-endoperoxide synthase 2